MIGRELDSEKANVRKWDNQWMARAVFGMVCALVIGIFAWFAEPMPVLELKSPPAKDSAYNLLVQGFRAGQLNMKREAPPGLAQLADPYDPVLNAAYLGDASDLTYYKGKMYLYFGVMPALVLFWPYVTLTGHYLSDTSAEVIFFALGFLITAGLLRAVWRRYFPEVSIWVATVGLLGLVAGMQKVLTKWCSIYEIAVLCGFAFATLTLAAIWRALHEPQRKVWWLVLASLAYGMAVGSRPSLLFGGIIVLMPVAQAWSAATESGSRRRIWLLLIAAVGPAMLVGLGLMLYNALRFDNPFEFGWHYQVNGDLRPTTAHQFSLHYLWFNFRYYFFEPIRWSSHYPFLQTVSLPPLPSGYDLVGDPYGGILTNYPLMWLALAAPLAWRGRLGEEVSVLRWFVATLFLLFVICAFTLCLFFAASSRYELDFLPALILLAVIGIFGLEHALVRSPVWRRIARWGWCLLLAYSVVFNLLTSVNGYAEANCLVGNSLLHLGQVDKAFIQYQKALVLWPECANAHAGLGSAFYQKRRLDEAIIEYQKALEINPAFAGAAAARNNLGYCYLQKGQVNEAITQFQKALDFKPSFAEAHNTLGDCFLQAGRLDEAMIQYQKAVDIKPDFAEAHNNLGYGLLQAGRVNEAIAQFQKAVEIKPDFAEAHDNLGYSLVQMGRADEAIVHYRKAIELQPQFVPAQINLAWMLATWPEPSVRNGSKAVALAEQAKRVSGDKDPQILRTLAAAYAEAGQFPKAVLTAKQALVLAVAQSNTRLTNVLQMEIGLYQTNSPCRSTSSYRSTNN